MTASNRVEHPAQHTELPEERQAALFLAAMRGIAVGPDKRRVLRRRDLDRIYRWAHQSMIDTALLALILDGAAYPFIDGDELCFHFRDGNHPDPKGTITLQGFGPDTDGPAKLL